ncbi:hypothetical protein ICM_06226 [Bacillus cereus BAG1X2-3]|uniref:Uncharacterized protein n=1 Tax=Bacillus cereus TaxID=1396 RepID=A0A9X7E6M5_BACCE|nr:hypothetical protein ICC_06373 [Bacillus cereus BAG1X1-1]EOO42783.1 hypothetical protein ICI_06290 [Bacillus cereus BAG1X2-1]EOO43894.1 hypothetical protein ICK_06587 [Bacillus cereus BAG1X2-2]EOO55925.1 hypothetical protein ICM_06226 [Bacillus cereus BAG1X2-3]EOO99865.1 hypothetical protein ICO_06637 [Bacillus cereus BAG2O-1]PHA21455.1 hypothetical protein COE70_12435 [Bacillus cereus]
MRDPLWVSFLCLKTCILFGYLFMRNKKNHGFPGKCKKAGEFRVRGDRGFVRFCCKPLFRLYRA